MSEAVLAKLSHVGAKFLQAGHQGAKLKHNKENALIKKSLIF